MQSNCLQSCLVRVSHQRRSTTVNTTRRMADLSTMSVISTATLIRPAVGLIVSRLPINWSGLLRVKSDGIISSVTFFKFNVSTFGCRQIVRVGRGTINASLFNAYFSGSSRSPGSQRSSIIMKCTSLKTASSLSPRPPVLSRPPTAHN